MFYRTFFSIGWLAWALALGAQQGLPDTLSLGEWLAIAQGQSLDRRTADYGREQAQFDYRRFQADFKPQVALSGTLPNYAKTFGEVVQPNGSIFFQSITNHNGLLSLAASQDIALTGGTLSLSTFLQRFDDFENRASRYNGAPFRLSLVQPLWGFNAFKWEKRLAPLRWAEAQRQHAAQVEAINSVALGLYFDLLVAQQDWLIAQANAAANAQLYAIAQEKAALGQLSENDLSQLQLEFLAAGRNARRAEQAVAVASAQMCRFAGQPYAGQRLVPRLPEVRRSIVVDPAAAQAAARSSRAEVLQYERWLLEAERELARAKRDFGFQADLVASFGYVRGAEALGEVYADPQQQQFLQVQFNVPIVDWGRREAAVGARRAERHYTEQLVAQRLLDMDIELQQVLAQFEAVQAELATVEQMQALAQRRFDIAKESFVLGAISITELTLAQREKDNARRDYIGSLQNYWTQLYALRRLTLMDF